MAATGSTKTPRARRTGHDVEPDPTRLAARPFLPSAANFAGPPSRIDTIVRRILALDPAEQSRLLRETLSRARQRFADIESIWLHHMDQAESQSSVMPPVTDPELRLLIGAYLTSGYAYESVALTNPSIVAFGEVDVNGVQRFVMSARAIGEGHISSIAFLSGRVAGNGDVEFDPRHPFVSNGELHPAVYEKSDFIEKLAQLDLMNEETERIMALVPPLFSTEDLDNALLLVLDSDLAKGMIHDAVRHVRWLAAASYEVQFDSSLPVSEHVVSPEAPVESHGMEDARFVRLEEEDGSSSYYATYNAYDGASSLPQLAQTQDFHTFRIGTLTGPAAYHKGMALFPRRVGGRYMALSRHDHETTFIMQSDHLSTWSNAEVLLKPQRGWEAIQTGTCASPVELDDGWLVITHGVGPMRRYVLGAVLLDLDEPRRVLGRLDSPLLEPDESESVGYVPDVVYSCGCLVHNDWLILPYGYGDRGIRVAVARVADLVARMS